MSTDRCECWIESLQSCVCADVTRRMFTIALLRSCVASLPPDRLCPSSQCRRDVDGIRPDCRSRLDILLPWGRRRRAAKCRRHTLTGRRLPTSRISGRVLSCGQDAAGCMNEICIRHRLLRGRTCGLLLAACALRPSLRCFPEQSHRKEGRRERGLGRGKLGTLVPSPQDSALGVTKSPASSGGMLKFEVAYLGCDTRVLRQMVCCFNSIIGGKP